LARPLRSANALGTLNRRLRDQGASFRALLGQTRYEIACQLLRDTRLATQDVASALGYADVTAFARAFRCWSETTPAAWRSAHQPD
jgi:AraC-like DNA-binding protein